MEQKGRVGIIILIILLMLSLAGAVIGFYSFQKERFKVVALNEELENVKVARRIAENKLAEGKIRITELNTQLQTTRMQIQELNSELQQAKSERNQLSSQIEELQFQLQEQDRIKRQWQAKQIQAQEEINKLQALLQGLQKSKDEKEEITLGKIVVEQKLTQPQAAPTLAGKVLVINKDYDFVVINLGSQDGIDVGDVFSIYHNDSYIGDIKVDKTREIMSACVFVSEEVRNKIRKGDKVIRK